MTLGLGYEHYLRHGGVVMTSILLTICTLYVQIFIERLFAGSHPDDDLVPSSRSSYHGLLLSVSNLFQSQVF